MIVKDTREREQAGPGQPSSTLLSNLLSEKGPVRCGLHADNPNPMHGVVPCAFSSAQLSSRYLSPRLQVRSAFRRRPLPSAWPPRRMEWRASSSPVVPEHAETAAT